MLTVTWALSWAWAWIWWAISRLLFPIYKLPVWLGFDLTVKEFQAWGETLGFFFALKQGWPVIELFSQLGRDENFRRV